MPRLTDVDALINDVVERYCKDCERRKGVKNGKKKFIYDIGDAPCRACEVDDMKYELENAPTIDAEPVVRCKDCKWQITAYCPMPTWERKDNHYCYKGEREEDVDN